MHVSLNNPSTPVHYEMLGFDSLLGSHYDKYEVVYANFDTSTPKAEVFDTPEGKSHFFTLKV